tara:strand:- start:261 stop:752 length:492 start_codon:yes stop_codon:yes gene_type:complete
MTKDNINKDGITFRQALKEYGDNLTPCESDTSLGQLINRETHPKHRNLISKEENFYHVEGLQKSVLRKLKRGNFSIFSECDLHGYRHTEAQEELKNFFKEIQNKTMVAVLLIHGKGLSSVDTKPVLKPLVKEFLLQEPRILAFIQAPRNLGGAGATLALLSKA